MPKNLTNEEFLSKLYKEHKSKYTPKQLYTKSWNKIEFLCNGCQNTFYAPPNSILAGKGCPKCADRNRIEKRVLTNDIFLLKLQSKHGTKYIPLQKYISGKTKMKFKCNVCSNDFIKEATSILGGHGCRFCDNIKKRKTARSLDEFIALAKFKHLDKYEYTDSNYINCKTPVSIKCNQCNNIFKQTPHSHLAGKGCPQCIESKGERQIRIYLESNKIQYIPQKSFPDFKNQKTNKFFRFDFYIESLNLIIEYQGQHHYQPTRFNGISSVRARESFKTTRRYDKMKRKYCIVNNIKLLTISYKKFKEIETILSKVTCDIAS